MFKLPDATVMAWSILEADRRIKAKKEAEAKALSAAPTALKRVLTRFFITLRDYHESVYLQTTGKGALLHFVDTRPLAMAAIDLAAAVKQDIPELRVPELLHLEAELRRHHGKPERGEGLDPTLRQRIDDAIALGKELHLLPDGNPTNAGSPKLALAARRKRKEPARFSDVLGTQSRTRLRRIAILRTMPAQTNKEVVGHLDEFGHGGPDDGTVSKDIKHLRAAGVVHATKLDLTAKGRRVLAQLTT